MYNNSHGLSSLFEYIYTIYSLWIIPFKSIHRLNVHHFIEGRVFANGLGDWGSIPGRVIPQNIVLDTSLLNTQHYKIRIKGKVWPSRERSSTLHYILV